MNSCHPTEPVCHALRDRSWIRHIWRLKIEVDEIRRWLYNCVNFPCSFSFPWLLLAPVSASTPRWHQLTSERLMGCLTSEDIQCFVGWVFSPAANPLKCLRSSISGCWIMIELCSQIYTKYTCYNLVLVDAGLTYGFFPSPGWKSSRRSDFNQAAGWLRLGGATDWGFSPQKDWQCNQQSDVISRDQNLIDDENIPI